MLALSLLSPTTEIAHAHERQLGTAVAYMALIRLECPFGWNKEDFSVDNINGGFPKVPKTLSITTTKISKIAGYLFGIGIVVGLNRMIKGWNEYQTFEKMHWHTLNKRSIQWIMRGALETLPVAGLLTSSVISVYIGSVAFLITIDLMTTVYHRIYSKPEIPFLEETNIKHSIDCLKCHSS